MAEEDKDRQIHHDRNNKWYEQQEGRPTAITLFRQLGYDITNYEDVQRLADDLRWAASKRKFEKEQKPHRTAALVSAFIAILSVALTLVGQWLMNKVTGAK